MKKSFFTILLICIYANVYYGQTNNEIIRWINNFEDANAIERLMEGTIEDKVNLECNNGYLTINTMVFNGKNRPPIKVKVKYKISDIKRIEAFKRVGNNNVGVDFNICSKINSFQLLMKYPNQSNYSTAPIEEEWIKEKGFCSQELRFSFPKSSADNDIERVYKAFQKLVENHGGNVKTGSTF